MLSVIHGHTVTIGIGWGLVSCGLAGRPAGGYRVDKDREAWLDVLSQVCERFNWVVNAWYQMTNHYHLLLETVDGYLSLGARFEVHAVTVGHAVRKYENGPW